MGLSVVKVATGGLPVTIATSGGLPCTEATNGFGIAVTEAPSGGGLAVTGFAFGPTIALSASSVLETAAVNTTVGTLSVAGSYTGTPVYTLTDSAGGKFNISGNLLRTNALLDYETATFHNVTVAVSGTTPATASRTIAISITDVLEPVIALTGTTVNEDAAVNTTVGTLSIANAYTGTPTYTLTDSAGGKFNISGNLLRVNAALDYETATTHSVTVSVSGITPAAANKAFTVVVLDVVETGGGTAIWNTADYASEAGGSLVFSGGDLIATGAGTNAWKGCRIVTGQSSGKFYAEFKVLALGDSISWAGFGIGTDYPSGMVGDLTYPGAVIASIGWRGDGAVFLAGTNIAPVSNAFSVNNVLAMAVDLDNKKIWFKNITTAGSWNANSGDPTNPATGISFSSITGTLFKAMTSVGYVAGMSVQANFGATAYQGTPPSGFVNWPGAGGGGGGLTKNIVTDYGAVADGQWEYLTLSIAESGTTLTSATPVWEAGDVGKAIAVGWIGQGHNALATTIASYVSPTVITLANTSWYALSAEPNIVVAWGTNNGKTIAEGGVDGPFETFRKEFEGDTVTLTIPAGIYCVVSGNYGGLWDGIRNITVNATGATICGGLFQVQASAQYGDTTHSARTASVSAGATSVMLTTPAQVSRFTPGRYALMTGVDLMMYGYPTNQNVFEYLLIAAVDSDTGSPTYGRVTFSAPLNYSYLSTWPHYNATGLDYGGPATLYAMNPFFDHTCIINNLTIAQNQQWAMAGKNLTFNNCVFYGMPGNSGPHPTMAISIVMNNCVCIDGTMEVDKEITTFEMNGCHWGGISIQSSSVDTLILDNTDIDFTVLGAVHTTIIRNGSTVGTLNPSTVYGYPNVLQVSNSVISNFGDATYRRAGHEIRSGDGTEDGIQTDWTIEDGVITVPASMRLLGGTSQWAVPGGRAHLYDPNVGSIGLFTITNVTEASPGGNILVATSMTLDDWPARTYGALGLWLYTHAAPACTFTSVTGCPEALMLSSFPANTPLYSRYSRSFGSATSVTTPYWQLYGRIKSVVVTVTTPYVGATGTLQATLLFGNATVKMSDYSDLVWNPVINLKTAGTRTFDTMADPYPTAWTGGVTGDTLTGMTEAQWSTANFQIVIGAFTPGTGPVFSVNVICDQGF